MTCVQVNRTVTALIDRTTHAVTTTRGGSREDAGYRKASESGISFTAIAHDQLQVVICNGDLDIAWWLRIKLQRVEL